MPDNMSIAAPGNAAGQALPPAPPTQAPPGELRLGNHALVSVKTAAAAKRAEDERKRGTVKAPEVEINRLSALVDQAYHRNADHRESEGIDDLLRDVVARRAARYTDTKAARLSAQSEPLIRSPLTMAKCDAAESLLVDVFVPGPDDSTWSLTPSPVPELTDQLITKLKGVAMAYADKKITEGQVPPEDAPQVAGHVLDLVKAHTRRKAGAILAERATNLESLMRDQLELGGWDEQMAMFLDDLVAYPAAIMKGPIIESRPSTTWSEKGELKVDTEDMPVFRRVDPHDFYPPPLCEGPEGPGPMVERVWIAKDELETLADRPGYSEKAIEDLLNPPQTNGTGDSSDVDDKLDVTHGGDFHDLTDAMSGVVECLEFHGTVPGALLIQYGLEKAPDGKMIKRSQQYHCTVLSAPGGPVIRAAIDDDPLGRNPYYVCSWKNRPGAIWSMGIPQQIWALQDVCDGSLRSMVRNMGFASGPQAFITDVDRIPEGEDIEEIYSLKLWQFTNERNSTLDPIKFFVIPSIATELNTIYDKYAAQADSITGLPQFDADMSRSAGRTASGLGMIMAGASKSVKRVVRRIHDQIVGPCMQRLAEWDMRFVDDPNIKGDARVVATGAVARVVREQLAQRRIEYLNVTNNPVDLKLVGARNRAEMLRAVAETLELGEGHRMTLSDAEIDELVAQDEAERKANAQAAQAASAAKAKQAEADAAAKTSKAQTDSGKASAEAQASMKELDLRAQRMQQDYQVAMDKIQLERDKLAGELSDREAQRMSDDIDTVAKLHLDTTKEVGNNDTRKDTGARVPGSGVPKGGPAVSNDTGMDQSLSGGNP